ncbi:MAG: hypothetical protein KJ058_08505 [Thermoanaerobaculia bacterium]|nr:hypothetical protein [Thermoanaerobaculia bacterium]
MSVQELSALHARYVDLSGRFKAAWTFHQFLQGLQNLSVELDLGKTRIDFQVVYGALKDVSQNLTSGAAEKSGMQLEFVARQLGQQMDQLTAIDARVSPSLLRQFFERVKNQDDKVLAQMVRFYLYTTREGRWSDDRIDKVDYLATKLAEEPQTPNGPVAQRDRVMLRDLFAGFWALALPPGEMADPDELVRRRQEIVALRAEVAAAGGLEELHQRGLVRRHRDIKHQLGPLFFEPELLLAVVDANLALKAAVQRSYRLEERQLAVDYQQILEMEGRVASDPSLDRELAELRTTVDQFERKQRQDDVKLDELMAIRRQVQSLLPRLSGPAAAAPPAPGAAVAARPAPPQDGDQTASALPSSTHEEILGPYFQRIVEVLEGTGEAIPPKGVTVLPEVFPLRLEPREVVAFRRLAGNGPVDLELERFLLEAAALRTKINEEAESIMGLLDESAVTRDAPVFGRARQTTRLADSFVQRFQHFMDLAIQDGNFTEAQALQLLRMRLIRDYSGLWLLVNRPTT